MKTLSELIESFEWKASMNECSIVTDEDLRTAAALLREYQRLTSQSDTTATSKISLNGVILLNSTNGGKL